MFTYLTPLNATLPIQFIKVHTTTKLSPASKYDLCFQINGKYSQAVKCVKSSIIAKVVNSILYIYTFEQ